MDRRVALSGIALAGLVTAAATSASARPHPRIEAALGALRDAREELDRAASDFGGHKVDAIRAIDAAIGQLKICLAY